MAGYANSESDASDQLVKTYMSLVKRIAHHLAGRLPSSVQADDLIQAGLIGLLEAAKKYDATKGASFETYAGIRVRGAMLDEIRKGDWVPRSVHRNARKMAEAIRVVENKVGRNAKDTEVADALGVSVEDYQKMLSAANGSKIFSFDEIGLSEDSFGGGVAEKSSEPLLELQEDNFKKSLATGISGLPERERLILSLYYDEELNLREIGDVLGVTESRVCQIHSQAMLRLKSRMHEWGGKQ